MTAVDLLVRGDPIDVGGCLLGLGAAAFPFAVDAEQRIGEPDGVVGLHDDVVGRVETPAFETVDQNRYVAVVLGAGDTARVRVLAGDESALAVTRVAVGVVGRAAEYREAVVLLVELHDPIVRNVAKEKVSAVGEVDRALGPAHASADLLERARIDPILAKARIEDLDGRVGIALVRPERWRLGRRRGLGWRRLRRRRL